MSDSFTTAAWSMGYTQLAQTRAPVQRFDGSAVEILGQVQPWWGTHLASAVSIGLGDLEWHRTAPRGDRYWGVSGVHADRSVSIRLPRDLERRGGETIKDEVRATVEVGVTPLRLGLWVIEAPPKWFRGRRAWAMNRPPFTIGDPWFDEHAGSWAWDCTEGPQALSDALAPVLPALREVLETQPGAIITNTAVSAWIPCTEMSIRLPDLLGMTQPLDRG
ncbi:MAG: hypothetical protein U9O63_03845 [Actinomycetota bacterium]|nr:hypothetical protein [Actinomycetota bacterium]